MQFPEQLIDGYRAFLVGRLRHEQDRYLGLAESGQSPQIMVIGCCNFARVTRSHFRCTAW